VVRTSIVLLSALLASATVAVPPSYDPLRDGWPTVVLKADDGWGQACRVGALAWTAAHVVATSPVTWAEPLGGGKVEVLRQDEDRDLAVVRLEGQPLARALQPRRESPQPGEHVRLVAVSLDGTRIVAHAYFLFETPSGYVFDGFVIGGMSGGCVVDDSGAVVGIVKAMQQLGPWRPVVAAVPAAWYLK
jgi:hypothetical protein